MFNIRVPRFLIFPSVTSGSNSKALTVAARDQDGISLAAPARTTSASRQSITASLTRPEPGDCSVCFSFHETCLSCPSRCHRFCLDDLNHLVLSVCREVGEGDDNLHLAHLDGKIRCPFEGSEDSLDYDDRSVFPVDALSRALTFETAEALKRYQSAISLARRRAERARLEEEGRLQQSPAYDRVIHHIHNNILTNHCPSCQVAWYDFDGCTRIQCENCKKFFCAFCGQRIYMGGHFHVKYCKHNPTRGDEFCNGALVMEIIEKRKAMQLERYLASLSADLKQKVILCDDSVKDMLATHGSSLV